MRFGITEYRTAKYNAGSNLHLLLRSTSSVWASLVFQRRSRGCRADVSVRGMPGFGSGTCICVTLFTRKESHVHIRNTRRGERSSRAAAVARQLSLTGKFSADLIGWISAGEPPRGKLVRNFLSYRCENEERAIKRAGTCQTGRARLMWDEWRTRKNVRCPWRDRGPSSRHLDTRRTSERSRDRKENTRDIMYSCPLP